ILVSSLALEKTWASYKLDVFLRGIPAWFDRLHPLYDSVKEPKRLEYLTGESYTEALFCAHERVAGIAREDHPLHVRAQLIAANARIAMLESRLSFLMDGWTWAKWRLLPWTKPCWRHNPLN